MEKEKMKIDKNVCIGILAGIILICGVVSFLQTRKEEEKTIRTPLLLSSKLIV